MAENVINSDLNLPEPPRSRLHTIPDGQGQSHCSRTQASPLVAVLLVINLLVAIALYLTLTTGSQQDSTALTSSSQNVSAPLSPSSQEESTELPPSHEEAPGRSCCSTTRVAVLVTEIILLLLLIVVCQILQYGPTAKSQQDSTTNIPEEALGCPPPWEKHGRKCYIFFPEENPKDWNASRAECTDKGSDLVVIDSREELNYLRSQSRHKYYFLGLTRSAEEQKWKWINNVEHDPAMFRIVGPSTDYLCTVIGFGEVRTAPCGESSTTQNMCEKAATISNRHL